MIVLEKPTANQRFAEPRLSRCVVNLGSAADAVQVKWLPTRHCDGELDSVIVDLVGDLSIFTAHEMKDLMSALIERSGHFRMVLNLRNLRYIDCTGFGVLITSLKRALAFDAVVAFAFASPQFTYLLSLAGASNIFQSFENEHAAFDALAVSKPGYARLCSGGR